MSILLKTNLCRANFPKCGEFWSIWRKSVPKKFFLRIHLQKLLPEWYIQVGGPAQNGKTNKSNKLTP